MMKYILVLFLAGSFLTGVSAQETEKKRTPVRTPFEQGIIIDNQTTVIPDKGSLQFSVQHKFGTMDEGVSDFWGVGSPGANMRVAFDYVPVTNLQIGAGLTKKNWYSDLNVKWNIAEQTDDNTNMLAFAIYGSVAVDGRSIDDFGSGKVIRSGQVDKVYNIDFVDRLSYFSQIILSRKFNNRLSLQTGASYTHYNMAGYIYSHDKVGLHFNGRFRVSGSSSVIFSYDLPLKIKQRSRIMEWTNSSDPNLAAGLEVSKNAYDFQFYLGTSDGIIAQDVMMWNQNNWTSKSLAAGFTVSRLLSF